MRTLKSIVLAGAMLLATPAFFSSCQENAPEIDYEMKVTVINDFTKVVDAINNSSLSNEQAIAKLVAAIDQMNADQQSRPSWKPSHPSTTPSRPSSPPSRLP